MVKFLDLAGLSALWNKIKLTFYTKSEVYTKTELNDIVAHELAASLSGDLTPLELATAVSTELQSLTDVQKEQVLINLGLALHGVVSQTLTWTKASDGGYNLTISNIRQGPVPQVNIDLFSKRGMAFNSTTGYFELNGLTNIAYDEAVKIYNVDDILRYYLGGDMNIGSGYRTIFRTGMYYKTLGLSYFRSIGNITNLRYVSLTYVTLSNSTISYSFYNGANYLVTILDELRCGTSTAFNGTDFQAPSLETVTIKGLSNNIFFNMCPRLSVSSILYMINNSTNTRNFTITLHASAYTRATADSSILTALSNHTNVTLASA